MLCWFLSEGGSKGRRKQSLQTTNTTGSCPVNVQLCKFRSVKELQIVSMLFNPPTYNSRYVVFCLQHVTTHLCLNSETENRPMSPVFNKRFKNDAKVFARAWNLDLPCFKANTDTRARYVTRIAFNHRCATVSDLYKKMGVVKFAAPNTCGFL